MTRRERFAAVVALAVYDWLLNDAHNYGVDSNEETYLIDWSPDGELHPSAEALFLHDLNAIPSKPLNESEASRLRDLYLYVVESYPDAFAAACLDAHAQLSGIGDDE